MLEEYEVMLDVVVVRCCPPSRPYLVSLRAHAFKCKYREKWEGWFNNFCMKSLEFRGYSVGQNYQGSEIVMNITFV